MARRYRRRSFSRRPRRRLVLVRLRPMRRRRRYSPIRLRRYQKVGIRL